jgi:hypothetical protein
MTTEEIKNELQSKIKEFEMQSKLVSLEVINWLNDLIKRMENHIVDTNKKVEKEIKVEVKEEYENIFDDEPKKPIKSR